MADEDEGIQQPETETTERDADEAAQPAEPEGQGAAQDAAPDAAPDAAEDAAAAAEEAVETASDAVEEIVEVAADPAAAVDEEMDTQTTAALKAAQDAIAAVKSGVGLEQEPAPAATTEPGPASAADAYSPPPLKGSASRSAPAEVELLSDVNLHVKIELGRTRMVVEDVLKLGEGAVVELDKAAGDPVDIYVNDRRVARGEILVINDCFCVRVSEIVAAADAA